MPPETEPTIETSTPSEPAPPAAGGSVAANFARARAELAALAARPKVDAAAPPVVEPPPAEGGEPVGEPPPAPEAAKPPPPPAEGEVPLPEADREQLATAQRQEKAWRERMTRERAEWEAERKRAETEWNAKIEAAKQFEALRERARYAPDAVLEALGLTEDDYEPAARALYARSRAGAADPRNREAAARMLRDREANDQLAAVRRELDELKRTQTEERQRAEVQTRVNAYLDHVTQALTSGAERDPVTEAEAKIEAPLVRKWAEKAPGKVRQRMLEVANVLAEELGGEAPSAGAVLKRLEILRRRELMEDGIDPGLVLGPPPAAPAPAAPPRPSRTLGQAGGGGAPPAGPKSYEERWADVRRELASRPTVK